MKICACSVVADWFSVRGNPCHPENGLNILRQPATCPRTLLPRKHGQSLLLREHELVKVTHVVQSASFQAAGHALGSRYAPGLSVQPQRLFFLLGGVGGARQFTGRLGVGFARL